MSTCFSFIWTVAEKLEPKDQIARILIDNPIKMNPKPIMLILFPSHIPNGFLNIAHSRIEEISPKEAMAKIKRVVHLSECWCFLVSERLIRGWDNSNNKVENMRNSIWLETSKAWFQARGTKKWMNSKIIAVKTAFI